MKAYNDVTACYTHYGGLIFHTALHYLQNREDAEDVMQETLIRYINRLLPFHEADHERAWLLRVAINLCKDHCRSAARRNLPLEDFADQLHCTFNEEELFIAEELSKLPPEDRAVLYLYYFRQMTAPEIAQAFRQKESTVKSRLRRAREKLKNNILSEKEDAYERL